MIKAMKTKTKGGNVYKSGHHENHSVYNMMQNVRKEESGNSNKCLYIHGSFWVYGKKNEKRNLC